MRKEVERSSERRVLNPWPKAFLEGNAGDLEQPYDGFSLILEKINPTGKVLDVACGGGRHTIELLNRGYEVFAFDLGESIVSLAKNNVVNHIGVDNNAKFLVADMYSKLPYSDEAFESIIAIQAIYHGTRIDMEFALHELKRLLKPDGILVFTVSTDRARSNNDESFLEVGEKEFIPIRGREAGLVHYFPTIADLDGILKNMYNKYSIEEDEKNSYYIITCER